MRMHKVQQEIQIGNVQITKWELLWLAEWNGPLGHPYPLVSNNYSDKEKPG